MGCSSSSAGTSPTAPTGPPPLPATFANTDDPIKAQCDTPESLSNTDAPSDAPSNAEANDSPSDAPSNAEANDTDAPSDAPSNAEANDTDAPSDAPSDETEDHTFESKSVTLDSPGTVSAFLELPSVANRSCTALTFTGRGLSEVFAAGRVVETIAALPNLKSLKIGSYGISVPAGPLPLLLRPGTQLVEFCAIHLDGFALDSLVVLLESSPTLTSLSVISCKNMRHESLSSPLKLSEVMLSLPETLSELNLNWSVEICDLALLLLQPPHNHLTLLRRFSATRTFDSTVTAHDVPSKSFEDSLPVCATNPSSLSLCSNASSSACSVQAQPSGVLTPAVWNDFKSTYINCICKLDAVFFETLATKSNPFPPSADDALFPHLNADQFVERAHPKLACIRWPSRERKQ